VDDGGILFVRRPQTPKTAIFLPSIPCRKSSLGNLWGSSVAVKKQDVKAAPRRKAAKKPFDKRQLWRMALWAVTAGCAVLLAVVTSRSEVGSQRLAALIASWGGPPAPPPFDAKAETKKLGDALRDLGAESERLRSRLTAVERHEQQVDNVTGSLAKQIEAVKAEAEAPRPADNPPVSTPAATPGAPSSAAPAMPSTTPSPFPPSSGLTPPPATGVQPPPPPKPAGAPSSSLTPTKQYGVDVGTAVSVAALRARWAEMRTSHPQLLQGLTPTAVTRGIPQSDRSELRLVLGPLPNSDAAARLCASLLPYRLFCQPTGFDGQQVALQ
jgi:hypothetical protein